MSYTVKKVLPAQVIYDAARADSPTESVTILGFDVIDTSVLAMTVEGSDGKMQQFPLWPTVRINSPYGKQMTGDQLLAALLKEDVLNEVKPLPPREVFDSPPMQPVRVQKLSPWVIYGTTAVFILLGWSLVLSF